MTRLALTHRSTASKSARSPLESQAAAYTSSGPLPLPSPAPGPPTKSSSLGGSTTWQVEHVPVAATAREFYSRSIEASVQPGSPTSPMAAFSAPATSHGMKGLIGDPSRLAMNAATIQDLHRTPFYPRAADLAAASFRSNNSEMLHAKVVNGTLVPTRPRLSPIEALLTLANGSPSDVSYLSDRPGHGANMTSRDAPKSRGRSSRSPRTLGGLPPHPAPWDLPWEVTSPMTPRPPTAGKTMSPPRRIAASHADDAPPKTAPTYPGPAVSASEWVSDDLVPSSRVEAIQTAEWLRQALTDR